MFTWIISFFVCFLVCLFVFFFVEIHFTEFFFFFLSLKAVLVYRGQSAQVKTTALSCLQLTIRRGARQSFLTYLWKRSQVKTTREKPLTLHFCVTKQEMTLGLFLWNFWLSHILFPDDSCPCFFLPAELIRVKPGRGGKKDHFSSFLFGSVLV